MEIEVRHRYLFISGHYVDGSDSVPVLADLSVKAKTPDGKYALVQDMSRDAVNKEPVWIGLEDVHPLYEVDYETGLDPKLVSKS